MYKNLSRLKTFMLNEIGKKVQPSIEQIEEEHKKGNVIDLPAEQVLVNMMSLMIFPFIARPVLQSILQMNEQAFNRFIDVRQDFLPEFIVGWVMK